ncbi:MAG: hypothetical protein ACPL3C_06265, partial [Pyrobaculum sp.]
MSRGSPYFYIQTSYAVVGLSGVRQIYEDAAKEYFEKMRKAACVKPYDWYSAAYYYSFAAFYNYVANSSSYGRSAIFRISSVQPKYVPYICDMSSDVPGAREFARLFLRGQRYRFMVWYLGYKVFDGWVTINSTKIKLLTDAVPVKIETLTKSARLPVDSYVGITFADALAGLAYKNLPTFENATTLLQPFEKALSVISDTLNLLNKDPEKQYIYHSSANVYKDGAVRRFGDVMPFTRGIEYSLPFAMMLFRNLTDPLKADISRDRLPYYPRDGVIHGAVMLPATSFEYYENISKVEASWYNRSYTGFYELAVAVNGVQSPVIQSLLTDSQGVVSVIILATVPRGGSANYIVTGRNYTTLQVIDERSFNGSIILNFTIKRPAKFVEISIAENAVYIYALSETPLPAGYITLSIVASNITTTTKLEKRTIQIPGGEYIVGIPRWIRTLEGVNLVYYYSVPDYQLYRIYDGKDWLIEHLRRFDIRGITLQYDSVERVYKGSLELWTYNDATGVFELLTYRTLSISVPYLERCFVGGVKTGVVLPKYYKVTLKIEARFAHNDTLIDSVTYDLSKLVNGTIDERPVVRLPLIFGKVASIAKYVDPDSGKGVKILYKFVMTVVDESGSKSKYGSYCRGEVNRWYASAVSLVPGFVSYSVGVAGGRQISTEGRVLTAGKYTIYTVPVYDYINATDDTVWRVMAAIPSFNVGSDWRDRFGFGAPLTAEFKAGDVAVLPAWLEGSAAYGSRIARIWIYTYVDGSRVKIVNYVPSVNDWNITRTYYNEFDAGGSGTIWGVGFLTSGTSSVVYSAIGLAGKFGEFDYSVYKGVNFWNSTELFGLTQRLGSIKLPTVALDEVEVANVAPFPIVVTGVYVDRGDVKKILPTVENKTLNRGEVDKVRLRDYDFGRTYDIKRIKPWIFETPVNVANYSVVAYYKGYEEAVQFFKQVDPALKVDYSKLRPLIAPLVLQNTLYESHHETPLSSFGTLIINEVTYGEWGVTVDD